MEKGILLLVICLSLYVRSAPSESKMVWLKDVTTSLQTDKRKFSDPNLPDNLTFQLRGGSRALTLNLKRNYAIDPNANIYFVRNSNDGRSHLEKAQSLEKEELAYYQDKQNGAFMTVKCLGRSNGGCHRVINGNILIEERNYDLQPAKTDITSRDLFDVPDLGTRYILRDQTSVQREMSVTYEDTKTAKIKQVLRSFSNGNDLCPFSNAKVVSRKGSSLHTRGNQEHVYDVETAVVLDSGIWEFYTSLLMMTDNDHVMPDVVARKLREVYSHIINGVDLRYKTIEDPSIEISVTLREFYILKTMEEFRHDHSVVEFVDGKDKVDVCKYLYDLALWTHDNVKNISDHVMLFTRYAMYEGETGKSMYEGIVFKDDEIVSGFSSTHLINFDNIIFDNILGEEEEEIKVIPTLGLYVTHITKHRLGVDHDGEGNAIACRAEDQFLMTHLDPVFDITKPYSRHPWIFSNCSVEVLKDELKSKTCLNNVGTIYNVTEWDEFTEKLPGQVYSPNQQCEFINGHGSVFCGNETADICHFMKCTDLSGILCLPQYFSAYRGTICGHDMWCKEGFCVSNALK